MITWSKSQRPIRRFVGLRDVATVVAEGPTQSGKSYVIGDAFALAAGNYRWSSSGFDGFGVFGPQMEQVKSMLYNIEDACRRYKYPFTMNANAEQATICGIPIIGKSIGVAGSRNKFQGKRLGMIIIDETTLCDEESFHYAFGRVSRPAQGMTIGKRFLATNPDDPSHWFHQWTDDNEIPVVRSSIDDNPVLTEEYKNDLKSKWTGAILQRMYYGRRAAHSGLIWPNLSRVVVGHEKVPIETSSFYDLSVDFGTASVTHVGLWHIASRTLVDEWRYDGALEDWQSPDQQAQNIATWLGDKCGQLRRIWCDPAAAHMIVALRNTFPLAAVLGAKNDVDAGIQQVSTLIENLSFRISDVCVETIRECSAYKWDEKPMKNVGVEKPLKKDDHAADMLRYYLHSEAVSGATRRITWR